MGKIVKKTNPQKELTSFIVAGKITADEIIKAIHAFYDGHVTANIIWDLTNGELDLLTSGDVKHIAELSVRYIDRRPFGKTAIVSSNDLEFGLSRMYEAHKEFKDLPFVTKSFKNIDDAHNWLASD